MSLETKIMKWIEYFTVTKSNGGGKVDTGVGVLEGACIYRSIYVRCLINLSQF
jgi:hypothetical protein